MAIRMAYMAATLVTSAFQAESPRFLESMIFLRELKRVLVYLRFSKQLLVPINRHPQIETWVSFFDLT